MLDSYYNLLTILNILLTLMIANFYYKDKARNPKETRYALIVLICISLRYLWFLIHNSGVYNELIMKSVTLMFSILFIFTLLWINQVFPLNFSSILMKPGKYLYYLLIAVIFFVFIPLSIILPPNNNLEDINQFITILFFIFQIFLVLLVILRAIPQIGTKTHISKWFYLGTITGVFLISFADAVFYWLDQDFLQLLSPTIGFILILGSIIGVKLLPLYQFIRMVDTAILICLAENMKFDYHNTAFKSYIPIELSKNTHNLHFNQIFKNFRIIRGFKIAVSEFRTIQIKERIFNYSTKSTQNVQMTFYPCGGDLHSPTRIAITIINSDEIEFLKQRKEFLFDILNHDIANVSQTLEFTLEMLKRPNIDNSKKLKWILSAQEQNIKLKKLIYCSRNLILLDNPTVNKVEEYKSLKDIIFELILIKGEFKPQFKIETKNLSELKLVETTKNLRVALELVLDTIMDTSDNESNFILITGELLKDKGQQKLILSYKYSGSELNPTLLEKYKLSQKSMQDAQSLSRITLLVATEIIQKNNGNLIIELPKQERNLFSIILILPFFDQ